MRVVEYAEDEAMLSNQGARHSGDMTAGELDALKSQVRLLQRFMMGSVVVSVGSLCVLAAALFGSVGSGNSGGDGAGAPFSTTSVGADGPGGATQLWSGPDNVIIPYGFKDCDSSTMPPQIAPVRTAGDFLFLSGILGYDVPCQSAVQEVEEQIEKAFSWADTTLKAAGVAWTDVMTVTSYHVNLDEHADAFQKAREKYLKKNPLPAWTSVGVSSLYFPGEVFEMQMVAMRKPCHGLGDCE